MIHLQNLSKKPKKGNSLDFCKLTTQKINPVRWSLSGYLSLKNTSLVITHPMTAFVSNQEK